MRSLSAVELDACIDAFKQIICAFKVLFEIVCEVFTTTYHFYKETKETKKASLLRFSVVATALDVVLFLFLLFLLLFFEIHKSWRARNFPAATVGEAFSDGNFSRNHMRSVTKS